MEYRFVAQREFWKFYLEQDDAYRLLEYDVPGNLRGELFRKYVSVVNIETSSYCNRRCEYCPVGQERTPKSQHYLDELVFQKIIEELALISYNHVFALNLFNEPLADEGLLQKIQYIKDHCAKSKVFFNSNGDYLTRELLESLIDTGVDQMLITLHTAPGERYEDERKRQELSKLGKRLRLELPTTAFEPGRNLTSDQSYRGMRLLVAANNWAVFGNDRGGTVQSLSKKAQDKPCMVPFREIAIAHDGIVRQCFNIYDSENPYGDMRTDSLVDVYFSDGMVRLRRGLLCFGEKEAPHNSCSSPDLVVPESERETQEIRLKLLESVQAKK